jgi:hypothetical protein
MAVPYTFATATGSLPLSQLDSNFATGIVIGNTTVALGDTITTINNLTLANVTVTSASFSNVTLSGTTTVSGNTTVFSATGARIQGDFSNATLASRTAFQDKTTNNVTGVAILPNGTAVESAVTCFNNSNPASSAYGGINCNATATRLTSGITGSGTLLPLLFDINGTEVARFTTAGQFLTGTTNASSTAGIGIKLNPDPAAPWVATVGSDNSGTNGSYYLYSTSTGSYRFYVLYNGTVNAVSTTITAISDARLKENIRDLDAGLPQIMALKPRRFDWKEGKGKDKKNDLGWIAQEFEQVFPEMIHQWKDPAPQGEEPYKAVNADLIPVLVRAIQEQQAAIDQLQARVAALEAA